MKYRYQTIQTDDAHIDGVLAEFGNAGWRLVQMFTVDATGGLQFLLVLEREDAL